MAFSRTDFSGSLGVGSDAPSIFTYRNDDDETTIKSVGYFNDMVNTLNSGDLIQTYSNGTTYISFLVVDVSGLDVTTAELVGA